MEKKSLIVLHFLIGVSAFLGGFGLVFFDGLGMPKEWLRGSIFSDYFWPGIILGLIVGGTQFLAFTFLLRSHHLMVESSVIASFGLLIWLFTEIFIVEERQFLQAAYFGLGIVTLIIAMQILKLNGGEK